MIHQSVTSHDITFELSSAQNQPAGIGRYARQLALALLSINTSLNFFSCSQQIITTSPPLQPVKQLRNSARDFRWLTAFSQLAHQPQDKLLPSGVLFHATDHTLPYLRRPSVMTLYDITPHTHPQYHLPLNRWYSQLFLPVFMRQASVILAISENTRREAERWLPWTAEKIVVSHLGVEPNFRPYDNPSLLQGVRQKYALPTEFILTVSTLEPRKNLVTLLKAYAALLTQRSLPPLVLAGKSGWKTERLHQCVRELNLDSHIQMLGYVPEDDLPKLMSAATMFVYPSFYEGFGLPPLEALACGAPVICSNTSSLPEVVGDAALMFDPHQPSEVAQAIERVMNDADLRTNLRTRGPQQAARFTWLRTAEITKTAYQRVLGTV